MDKHQKRFVEVWGKEREKGQIKYVILNTLIFFFLLYVVTSILNFRDIRNGDYSELLYLPRVGMYLVASLLIVVFRWRRNERMYKKYTKDSEAE
jgi:hypothetical protein